MENGVVGSIPPIAFPARDRQPFPVHPPPRLDGRKVK